MAIRLRLFGSLDLRGDDDVEIRSVLAQPKRTAILAYLAAAEPAGFTRRDTLLSMFWPELDEAHARNALSKSLHHLRRSLGRDAIVNRGTVELGIAPSRLWCDVAAFESMLETSPEAALDLYAAGPLLNGFILSDTPDFEHWIEARRAYLQRRAIAAAGGLSERAEASGELEVAVLWAGVTSRTAPYDEIVLRRRLELLDRAGDRAGALRSYEAFATRLERDLDLTPSPETMALVRAIRARTLPTVALPDAPALPIPIPGGTNEPRVVEDAGASPGSVQTRVEGQGDVLARESGDPYASVAPADHRPQRRSTIAIPHMHWMLALALIAVAVIAILPFVPRSTVSYDDALVIAVAFANETGDPTLDPIGRLAQDWIAQELLGTGLVRVVDLLSAATAIADETGKTSGGDALAVARAFGAGLIVQGTYFIQRDSLRFVANITDVKSGSAIRPGIDRVTAAIEDPLAGVQRLESLIAGALAAAVDPRLASLGTPGRRPPNYQTYLLFIGGLEDFQSGRVTEAMDEFEAASRADPEWALPIIWKIFLRRENQIELADSLPRQLASTREPRSRLDRLAIEYFQASRPRPGCPSRRFDLCPVVRPDLQLDRALEGARLAPGSLWSFLAARNLMMRNQPAEALRHLQDIDPETGWARDWLNYWVARTGANHLLGDHRSEMEGARRLRRLATGSPGAVGFEALALIGLGDFREAEARVEELLRLPPDRSNAVPVNALRAIALEFHTHGDAAAAERVLERAISWVSSPAAEAWIRIRPPAEQASMRAVNERFLVELLFLDDRLLEADSRARSLLADDSTDWTAHFTLGRIAVRNGDATGAERELEWFRSRNDYWTASRIAALLGDRDRALEYLRYAQSNADMDPRDLHRSADWDSLREDPDFRPFLTVPDRHASRFSPPTRRELRQ